MGGYKTWANTEILEAADLNSYLMTQAVPRFASTAARSAAIPAPVTGQLSIVDALGPVVWIFDGTWLALVAVPPGGTTGQVLTKLSGDDFDVGWTTP